MKTVCPACRIACSGTVCPRCGQPLPPVRRKRIWVGLVLTALFVVLLEVSRIAAEFLVQHT